MELGKEGACLQRKIRDRQMGPLRPYYLDERREEEEELQRQGSSAEERDRRYQEGPDHGIRLTECHGRYYVLRELAYFLDVSFHWYYLLSYKVDQRQCIVITNRQIVYQEFLTKADSLDG